MYVLGADIKINKEKNFNTKTKKIPMANAGNYHCLYSQNVSILFLTLLSAQVKIRSH